MASRWPGTTRGWAVLHGTERSLLIMPVLATGWFQRGTEGLRGPLKGPSGGRIR